MLVNLVQTGKTLNGEVTRKVKIGEFLTGLKIDSVLLESYSELHQLIATPTGSTWAEKTLKPAWRKFVLPHQQRVLDEVENLSTLQDSLSKFIFANPEFSKLQVEDRQLMMDQNVAMVTYLAILERRVDRFVY